MSSWHSASFPKIGSPVFHISRIPLLSTETPKQETLDIVLNSLPYADSQHVWVHLHAKLILQPRVLTPPSPLTCFSGLPASHLPASDLTFLYSSTPQAAASAFSVSGTVPRHWQNEESIRRGKPCGQWEEPTFTVLCGTQVSSVCKEAFGTKRSLKGPLSKNVLGNSLMVQWLGLSTLLPRAWGSVPGWRTKVIQIYMYSKCQQLSCVLVVTPWNVAHQAPLSMEFSRQECWSGLPFPPPGYLPYPGIEPWSPTLQADSLLSEPPRRPHYIVSIQ